MYFNYHAKVKNLIKNGEATGYEILESYHNISPCLLIYFKNNRPRVQTFETSIKLRKGTSQNS